MRPLVTIGIPTFDRAELLRRALRAAASQDYSNLEVLVSDNASPGNATSEAVDAFRHLIPNLSYTKQATNIGPVRNFQHLLDQANGDYFMWLADDDEISANYVSALVDALEADPSASSAAGHWMLVAADGSRERMKTSSYPQASAIDRAIRFVWRSDDAFFYAVHRTTVLRQSSFRGYAWPNQQVILNWAYVYLFDVVLRGPIFLASDPTVEFINHNYTAKTYAARPLTLRGRAVSAMRRVNVHALYWTKAARILNPLLLPLVVFTSIVALARDGTATIVRRGTRIFA